MTSFRHRHLNAIKSTVLDVITKLLLIYIKMAKILYQEVHIIHVDMECSGLFYASASFKILNAHFKLHSQILESGDHLLRQLHVHK